MSKLDTWFHNLVTADMLSLPGGAEAAAPGLSVHPGYGSFHQLYRLNGELIAVGVLDVLPRRVVSRRAVVVCCCLLSQR